MLRLKCPVQNYAWGRKPDTSGGKRGSEVTPNGSKNINCKVFVAPRLHCTIVTGVEENRSCLHALPVHLVVNYHCKRNASLSRLQY